MNENDFNRLVKSLFLVIMVIFFLSMFLMISIYSKSILSVNADKVKHTKTGLSHSLEIEKRFLTEEFFSESFDAIAFRLKRLLQSQGISSYEIQILNQKKCIFSSDDCKRGEAYPKERYIKLEVPVTSLNKLLGSINLYIPLSQLEKTLTAYDHLKVYLLPLFAIIGLYLLWSRVIDKNIIQPYLKKLIKIEQDVAIARVSKQVAHDIRSPLAVLESVLGMVDINNEKQKLLLLTSIERMKSVSDQLLRSKDERLRRDYVLDLYELAERVVSLKNEEVNEEVTISFLAQPKKYNVNVNPGKLESIICNLINNSIESYPEGIVAKNVEVVLSQNGHFFELSIKDYGSGIPPEISSEIFNEGFSTKEYGNGLGLSQVRSFIHQCGGQIKIETGKEGTLISLLIPERGDSSFLPFDIPETVRVTNIDDDPFYRKQFILKMEQKFRDVQVFSCFREVNAGHNDRNFYFVDYELQEKLNGLEYIVNNQLEEDSVLLTNMADDVALQQLCKDKGVRLLSKDDFYSEKDFQRKIVSDSAVSSLAQ